MNKPDVDFLKHIFDNQPGRYIGLSVKNNEAGTWKDVFFTDLTKAIRFIKKQPETNDVYFCPTKFASRKRRKEFAQPSKFLWSDLDEINPDAISSEHKPTHAWESSPGRYQALWELDHIYSSSDIEDKNKGLAYSLGADKSGWDITQVLRIPGTYNNKYPARPPVKLMWANGVSGKPLINFPEPPQTPISDLGKHVELIKPSKTRASLLIKKHKHKIPRPVLRTLMSSRAEEGKRSDVIWRLAHELVKVKLAPGDIFNILKASIWNKYRGRRDEAERLSHDIRAALQNKRIEQKPLELKEAPKSTLVDREKVERNKIRKQIEREELEFKKIEEAEDITEISQVLKVTDHFALMAAQNTSPGWLIDKFWTQDSHGIIAGEPKSFKSTLLLDFMISVASGKPFLDLFDVTSPGPVLYVQNENSDWIMQDRANKIQCSRELGGTFEKKLKDLWVTMPPKLPIYYVNQQGYSFSNSDHNEQIEILINKLKPKVVAFDPLYLMFDGDVNSAKDLGPILSFLLYLKQEYKCSIILVHHWNKSGASKRGGQRMLGSTTLHGWIESAWYLNVLGLEASEDKEQEVQAVAANVKLSLEREFRGAGTYPKIDLILNMGEFGEDRYEVEVKPSRAENLSSGKKNRLSAGEAEDLIVAELATSIKPVNIQALCRSIECSRRLGKAALVKLEEQKIVKKVTGGYTLTDIAKKSYGKESLD